MTNSLSVIILTYNEEANIGKALSSVCGWAKEVFIVDSFSTDNTLEIAAAYPCKVFRNQFSGYATQRNYALTELPITTEWGLFLDADEWLTPELKKEIDQVIKNSPVENGFYIKRRMVWMGRWIKRGYYPTWILRLFRIAYARCEDREINEHIVVEGKTGQLRNDFIHEDRRGLSHWIEKHNKYAEMEAKQFATYKEAKSGYLGGKLSGSQAERKRWLRENVWERLPPLVRPFIFFGYRYFVRGGFLDGREALVYHFLQGLWFPFLVDAKYLEMRRSAPQRNGLRIPRGRDYADWRRC